MSNNLEEEIRAIVAGMDNERQMSQEQENQQPSEEIQDVYVLIVRETEVTEDQANIIDSTPKPVTPQLQKVSFLPAYAFCSLFVGMVIACLVFQTYLIFNPAIATIIIIPKSEQVTLNGTLQLGRLLPPITLSLSQTTATTGHGHQDAKQAQGYITFYNGQFQSISIAAGLILTGSSGVQIMTDQDATIPPGSPSTGYGHTSVSAHAMGVGSKGNIPAYDIDLACCATSVLAVNPSSFQGGQDERSFHTVTQHDIHSISTVLKTILERSIAGALQGQVSRNEQLQLLPCSPMVTPNHNNGDEAIQVKVTMSAICSAVAYNTLALQTKATQLLTTKAYKQLGAGYSLFGNIQIKVIQASITNTSHPPVFLFFKASGTYLYGLSRPAQEHLKALIAGKPKDQALYLLATMPGVKLAAIRIDGFTDGARLPKNTTYLHLILLVA